MRVLLDNSVYPLSVTALVQVCWSLMRENLESTGPALAEDVRPINEGNTTEMSKRYDTGKPSMPSNPTPPMGTSESVHLVRSNPC
jgi:hypothetical protein